MKKVVLIIVMFAATLHVAWGGRKDCIDHNWQFFYGDGSAALTDDMVTNGWRTLDLPHDWSVETEAAQAAGGTVVGPFSTNSVGKYQTGFTVGGEGWYRKSLSITAADLQGQVSLYFEGAYNQTDVYLNGKHIYFNPYGYSSFKFDVTAELNEGENTLLVRVRNEGSNTRWYAGSGIYRHVWLIRTPQLRAEEWDTYIQADGEKAEVSTRLYNGSDRETESLVSVRLMDAEGYTVANAETTVKVAADGESPVSLTLPMENAHRWTPETPYLYKAVISVTDKTSGTTDELVKRFGVRTLSFSAEEGFLLNGVPTLLRGGCIHHDNGLLGAAAYDAAEVRKISLLKAQGYNALRCSHNLPSEHFLDACDSLGMMVIDETFDQWYIKKNNEDYHRYFAEFGDRDLQVMLRRDRNHPSIIMWSIGNEIPGRIETAGLEAAARMRRIIHDYDTTRPVTAAICSWDQGQAWNSAGGDWTAQDDKAFRSLDVGGYNYLYGKYEHDHGTHPDRVMYGSETYPKEASQNWDKVEQLPYVIGDFVWTAMDYLGEAGIGSASVRTSGNQSMFQSWPWYNGWCGDIDLIGQKKPQSYYRDVIWRQAPITMGVQRPVASGSYESVSAWGWPLEEQSWTYPDLTASDLMTVNVYSRQPKVRLYLNGELIGEKTPGSTYTATFSVPYTAGTLRAVNVTASGEELTDERFELQTTGTPVALRLTVDRPHIKSNGSDLAYVTIELVDAEGRVITSDSERKVTVAATGDGQFLAAGNGSNTDMESFRSTTPRLYQGRALAILKSSGTPGTLRLTVTSDGLPDQQIDITTSKEGVPASIGRSPLLSPAQGSGIYDLTGRRLSSVPDHGGLFIVDGKKVVR